MTHSVRSTRPPWHSSLRGQCISESLQRIRVALDAWHADYETVIIPKYKTLSLPKIMGDMLHQVQYLLY